MLDEKELNLQGKGGYYNDREIGIAISFSYDNASELYSAWSTDVLGITACAHSRDVAIRNFQNKYHATWTLFRINVLKSRVKTTFEDRNQELTAEVMNALTDLCELSLRAKFDDKLKVIRENQSNLEAEMAKISDRRSTSDYWSITLFLVSAASAGVIANMITRVVIRLFY